MSRVPVDGGNDTIHVAVNEYLLRGSSIPDLALTVIVAFQWLVGMEC